MHDRLTTLQGVEQLNELIAASGDRPLLLFKHSYTCGISMEALDAVIDHLNDNKVNAHYAMVTVQTHRDVSNAVSSRLGIRHETPQVLLIRDGRVVWSASHFRVTAKAVEAALRAVEPAGAR